MKSCIKPQSAIEIIEENKLISYFGCFDEFCFPFCFDMYFGKRLRELRLFCYQSWQIDEFFTRKTCLDLKNYSIKFD